MNDTLQKKKKHSWNPKNGEVMEASKPYTRVHPKVSGMATWHENCRWYSSLSLGEAHRYFVSQSSEFCRHKPLCCFSMSVYCCKRIYLYRLNGIWTASFSIWFSCFVKWYLIENYNFRHEQKITGREGDICSFMTKPSTWQRNYEQMKFMECLLSFSSETPVFPSPLWKHKN
jgi:hypothetical protein